MEKKNSKLVHRYYKVRASAVNDYHARVNGVGHVCVVLSRSKKTPTNYKAAVSFKSPADHFDKERGIQIASGRLRSRKPGRNFRVTGRTVEAAVAEVLRRLLDKRRKVFCRGKAISRPYAPDWFYAAVVEKERQLLPLKL